MTIIRDETVIVKISKCQKCNSVVRVAVKHMMDKKSTKEFGKEVMDYNLSVSEITIEEYRKNKEPFCKCK
jgi:hypothetical protein